MVLPTSTVQQANKQKMQQRIGEVSKLFVDGGIITLCAFISPFRDDRRMVRDLFDEKEFIEVFVDTSIEECERRDPKGMYQKARKGEIKHFTGIDSPYEAPLSPDLDIKTDQQTIDECVKSIFDFIVPKIVMK